MMKNDSFLSEIWWKAVAAGGQELIIIVVVPNPADDDDEKSVVHLQRQQWWPARVCKCFAASPTLDPTLLWHPVLTECVINAYVHKWQPWMKNNTTYRSCWQSICVWIGVVWWLLVVVATGCFNLLCFKSPIWHSVFSPLGSEVERPQESSNSQVSVIIKGSVGRVHHQTWHVGTQCITNQPFEKLNDSKIF